MFGEWEFDGNLIWENVYLGGLDSAYDEAGLKSHGITHILHVEDYFDPKFTANYEYLVIRIADTGTSSLLPVLEETRKFINKGRQEGKVLIHCAAGVSRSSSVLVAWMLAEQLHPTFGHHATVDACISYIQDARPQVSPHGGFISLLRKYRKNGCVLTPELIRGIEKPKVEIWSKGQHSLVKI